MGNGVQESLTDAWIDGMDFERLPWWVETLGVSQDDIHLLGVREAIKLRVVSDDHGIQADRPLIESECF